MLRKEGKQEVNNPTVQSKEFRNKLIRQKRVYEYPASEKM